jgi:hypothetical protein
MNARAGWVPERQMQRLGMTSGIRAQASGSTEGKALVQSVRSTS